MYSKTCIIQIMGSSPKLLFQINQISALIRVLMKRDDIFRPLTEFESLFCTQENKGLMSKLYRLLLCQLPWKNNTKDRWEKDL